MKKTILLSLTVAALALSSCNDMLEKSPRDTPINDPAFWQNENLVSSYCNTFFEDYSGYGTGTGGFFTILICICPYNKLSVMNTILPITFQDIFGFFRVLFGLLSIVAAIVH